MKKYEESDKLKYEELNFKKEAMIKIEDLTNNFINEELLKTPLYKKILIDKKVPSYNFFHMMMYELKDIVINVNVEEYFHLKIQA